MDLFDERVLTVLRDGRPRHFHQLLREVGFSHNTLRLHLNLLVDQGLAFKEKTPIKGPEDLNSRIRRLSSSGTSASSKRADTARKPREHAKLKTVPKS